MTRFEGDSRAGARVGSRSVVPGPIYERLPTPPPLTSGELEKRLDELPRDRPVVSMYSVGHRGGIGAGILARHGFRPVYDYLGGFSAWKAMR